MTIMCFPLAALQAKQEGDVRGTGVNAVKQEGDPRGTGFEAMKRQGDPLGTGVASLKNEGNPLGTSYQYGAAQAASSPMLRY